MDSRIPISSACVVGGRCGYHLEGAELCKYIRRSGLHPQSRLQGGTQPYAKERINEDENI